MVDVHLHLSWEDRTALLNKRQVTPEETKGNFALNIDTMERLLLSKRLQLFIMPLHCARVKSELNKTLLHLQHFTVNLVQLRE